MTRMLYQVSTGYGDIALSMLLPLVMLVGIGLVIRMLNRPTTDAQVLLTFGSRRRPRWFLYLGGAFVVGCMLVMLHGQLTMHRAVVGAWQRGEYAIVEGSVENFVPRPAEGHANESFDIGDVHFEYSDDRFSAGYHTLKVNGGVIRGNGQKLRIGYVWYESYGNVIVSIEEMDGE